MGALIKEGRISGKTLESAFRSIQDKDRRINGDDYYSGGWNLATGIKEISAMEYDKKVNTGNISKHEPVYAKCVRKPVKNTNTIKTRVENNPNKGSRVWETLYVVEHVFEGDYIGLSDKSQTEAIKKARKYVEKNPFARVEVNITKVLVKGVKTVAKVTYKPSSKEADGEWEIYGCMSY